MKKYLVIGNPIEHTLSPKLHNHWIKKNNINAAYDKKKINKADGTRIRKTKFKQHRLTLHQVYNSIFIRGFILVSYYVN